MKTGLFSCVAATLLLAQTSLSFAQTPDVDWKVYGVAQAIAGIKDVCFYDSIGVVRQQDNHLRVWIKCVSQNNLENFTLSDEQRKKITDAAAQQIMRGYVPPVIAVGIVESKKIPDMVTWEQIADIANIQPDARILYEIDCADQKVRQLSTYINISGKELFKDTSDWKYASPETNLARLSKILCQARPLQ